MRRLRLSTLDRVLWRVGLVRKSRYLRVAMPRLLRAIEAAPDLPNTGPESFQGFVITTDFRKPGQLYS